MTTLGLPRVLNELVRALWREWLLARYEHQQRFDIEQHFEDEVGAFRLTAFEQERYVPYARSRALVFPERFAQLGLEPVFVASEDRHLIGIKMPSGEVLDLIATDDQARNCALIFSVGALCCGEALEEAKVVGDTLTQTLPSPGIHRVGIVRDPILFDGQYTIAWRPSG